MSDFGPSPRPSDRRSGGGMTTVAPAAIAPRIARPGLVFFHSRLSGNCRRVEGFLAQVLQRRRNHGTVRLYSVAEEERPDLLERFGVDLLPALVLVENQVVPARLEC